MAPAPKKKVEEPSSEYYSETAPPAEGRGGGGGAKERPAEPEADYGGTDDEPTVVPQPKEAKEAIRQRSQSRSSGWQSQK